MTMLIVAGIKIGKLKFHPIDLLNDSKTLTQTQRKDNG